MLEIILSMIPGQFCLIESGDEVLYPKNDELLYKVKNILNHPLNGEYFFENSWYHSTFKTFLFEEKKYNVIFLEDITLKKQLEDFKIDSVTHLLIKKVFFEEINKKTGVIVIGDIDYFKKVNDTFGHLAGDKVLEELGFLLKNNLRSCDVIGRYGGEEFVIFLRNADSNSAYKKIEEIRKLINCTLFTEYKISLSMSFGLTVIENDITDSLKKADDALYYAKEHGRNKTILYNADLLNEKKR